ncbi:MAG: 16S rRNA (adenine(1518)-N(6)/adenine(1519)-N(6))-dimethyltransferase RsmA [Aquisalimonadaceae bacterium]
MNGTANAHRARKRFGQNFLHDSHVIDRIVRAVAPRPGDPLVEIGPGQGAITLPLLRAAGRLEAVEMDRDLLDPLLDKCADAGELVLHQGDALNFDFSRTWPRAEHIRIVGNLPYNISTPLIFHLLTQAERIVDMHFMLQREVVDRIASAPGSRVYGRLSVMVQYHCRVERLFTVASGAFRPAPKVESAVVRLIPLRTRQLAARDPARFATVVAAAFGQRRKTLRNTLRDLINREDFEAAGIDPGNRAEQLSVDDFVRLSNRGGD